MEEDDDVDYNDILLEESNSCEFEKTSSSENKYINNNDNKDILKKKSNYVKVLKYCPRPCGTSFQPNDPMCIRTCLCPQNHFVTKEGKCIRLNESMSQEIRKRVMKNVNKVWRGGMDKWSPENRSQRDEG